uniref:Uncharacterized protein n=1 Tax=Avena sativa TaxID=4498 RepID=A0ACD5Y356_AVESA
MAVEDVGGTNTAAAAAAAAAAACRRRWRCADAARYVVALAVTAAILTVLAHAIRVLLRPQDLFLQIDNGFVAVERGTWPAWNLSFSLDLEVTNPSGRVAIYYEHVYAYLYGRANNASEAAFFVAMSIGSISLKQQSTEVEYLRSTWPNLTSPGYKPYFDLFNSSGNNGIPGGVVAVNGSLTIGLNSWHNKTPTAATYYCWPVAIGGDSSENVGKGDALCMDNPPMPDATLNEDSWRSFVL